MKTNTTTKAKTKTKAITKAKTCEEGRCLKTKFLVPLRAFYVLHLLENHHQEYPSDLQLVDCPTQLICTWIFICYVP